MTVPNKYSLEGEILHGRYAVLKVSGVHGDRVRCDVFDMQQTKRLQAEVRVHGAGEYELHLLPPDEGASAGGPAGPPPGPGVTQKPPPRPEGLGAAASPPAASAPDPGRKARPGKLEAAWFAVGADADRLADEDRPTAADGDLIIAPSRMEYVANDLTTGTYRRYSLDDPSAVETSGSPRLEPIATGPGSRRPGQGMWLAVIGAGVVIGLLVVAVLAMR